MMPAFVRFYFQCCRLRDFGVSHAVGDNFDLGHVTRALCCRVTESLTRELPDGYSLRHPFIGRVSVYEPATKPGNPSRNISINWSADDKVPEVLDANEGKSIDEYVIFCFFSS